MHPDTIKIINGDCLEEMRKMADNIIDFIVTDSPYGISFMGKGWDKAIPSIEYWQEMLRICKPGAMMACAGMPRMYHRLACVVEDAGWEIRDCIMHLFGSGFPKSHNFGRKLAEEWHGYGTALKPAYEPWLIAMKPLEGTFAQNAEKWGVAGLNIDDSRVGLEKHTIHPNSYLGKTGEFVLGGGEKGYIKREPFQVCGRWPANMIFDEEAAGKLDQMTGVLPPPGNKNNSIGTSIYGSKCETINEPGKNCYPGEFGKGASRFFYVAKASSSERNRGLEEVRLKDTNKIGHFNEPGNNGALKNSKPMANSHPTVKPIALMKYLLKLLAPPGYPLCLDPFAGSGSTLVAACELNIRCIGIEKEKEYYEIAEARIRAADMLQSELF
jgi:site-specific DNA-methyltransferase (adenine-specific)